MAHRGGMTGRFTVAALSILAVVALVGTQGGSHARQAEAPADVRDRLEGTWVLEEWHHEGQVLRPPAVGGRWSNNDGVVMATFYRQSGGSFQSFAGYGTYEMTAETWGYAYERIQTTQGTSPEDAVVSVRVDGAMRSFDRSREGDTIVLTVGDDRREYDDQFFVFMPGGTVLRKYRKVQ